jgi:hypothetical protein
MRRRWAVGTKHTCSFNRVRRDRRQARLKAPLPSAAFTGASLQASARRWPCRRRQRQAGYGSRPQRLERIALMVDHARRSEPDPPEDRHGRAPTLDGVLEQEPGDHGGQEEEPPVHRCTQGHAHQDGGSGVGLQRPLDVPLLVKLGQAPLNGCWTGRGVACDVFLGLAANLLVDVSCRVLQHRLDVILTFWRVVPDNLLDFKPQEKTKPCRAIAIRQVDLFRILLPQLTIRASEEALSFCLTRCKPFYCWWKCNRVLPRSGGILFLRLEAGGT